MLIYNSHSKVLKVDVREVVIQVHWLIFAVTHKHLSKSRQNKPLIASEQPVPAAHRERAPTQNKIA